MTHASLFSGIGGPEVAAAMLGWDNAFHCEINPFGRKVLEYWFPDSVSYEDITQTDFTQWRGKVDILTGGFPCQPFSCAGKRGGQNDARYLWPEMCRAIQEIRPTWVVGENVAGITTMVEGGLLTEVGEETPLFEPDNIIHGYELEQTFTIERICSDLEHIGYSVQPMLIPAAAVGAPHRRDRIFIIAFAADSDNSAALRGSEKHEGESQKEWLSERDDIQFVRKSGNVRQETCDASSDTANIGLPRAADAGAEREIRREMEGARHKAECGIPTSPAGIRRSPSDTDSHRGYEVHEHLQPGQPDGTEPLSDGRQRNASHTKSQQGGFRPQQSQYSSSQKGQLERGSSPDGDGLLLGLLPEKRWRCFPTISPVYRGNDGIPFDVDGLTISFSKWRTESLKAYGNAIVPQVMYRIFQVIDKL